MVLGTGKTVEDPGEACEGGYKAPSEILLAGFEKRTLFSS